MSEVFAAATASAKGRHGLFQKRGHVMGLAIGLSENDRGLRGFAGEQCDDGGRLPREFLGEQFEIGEIAARKRADD